MFSIGTLMADFKRLLTEKHALGVRDIPILTATYQIFGL